MTNTERTNGLVSPAQTDTCDYVTRIVKTTMQPTKGKEIMPQSVSTSTKNTDEPICQHLWCHLVSVTFCMKCGESR